MVLLAGALIATGFWLAWPRDPLLMKVARPIVRVDTVKQELCWLSAHQLLIVTTEEESCYTEDRNGSLATAPWQGSADVLDLTTHTKTHLVALTNLLKRTSSPDWGSLGEFEISPDGVWLLWETHLMRGASSPYRHLARLDGTHYRDWSPEKGWWGEAFFLDAAHLVQMKGLTEKCLMVCDLQSPQNDREYRQAEQAKIGLAQYADRQPFFVRVVKSDNRKQDFAEIEVYRTEDQVQTLFGSMLDDEATRVRNAPSPIRTRKLAMPTGADLWQWTVSPQQRSIFYDIQNSRTSPLLSWLHRLLPHFSKKPTAREELWVSEADGQGMHAIGYIPIPSETPASDVARLEHLQWLPDGKQISFLYRDTLYVVSAKPKK